MNKFLNFINQSKSIAILTHKNPDGDAIGSALMVYEFLDTYFKGKKKAIFTEYETLSDEFKLITKGVELNPEDRDFDSAICVDTGDKYLFGIYEHVFDSAKQSICIDHHKTNTEYANISIVECLSSNSEHLYNILKGTGFAITKQIGKYACVGIMTDTNALANNNVDFNTYKTVAELAILGVDVYSIRKMFFSGNSFEKYKIIARAMSKVEFLLDNKVMFINLTKQDFDECGLHVNDTEGIIGQAFNLKSAYACFLVTPRDGIRRISMRSVDGIDVSKIAESFGGGGHVSAAASNTDLCVEQIKEQILNQIEQQIKNIKPAKDIF